MSAATRPEIGEKVRTAAPSADRAAALIAVLYFGRVFIITLTTAVIVSFMLEPLVGLAMRLKMPRGLASFVVCSFALLALYLAGVGAYTQVSDLMDELPAYSERINELIDGVSLQMEEMEQDRLSHPGSQAPTGAGQAAGSRRRAGAGARRKRQSAPQLPSRCRRRFRRCASGPSDSR